ncbi:MAG: Sensory/regulatory protein RpfC [Pseudomonas sp.]|nr:MAG: Sensory/regulatory protein RpfC [Pseudomonas sp.]
MPGHSPATSLPYHNARKLVVDDHRAYRLLMEALLAQLGLAHQACADGQQALELLASEPFDLVITDCRMPVMDGYAMTRQLRQREQAAGRATIPVLAYTATLGPDEIRHCMACGMNGWLTKPVGLAQLDEVLRDWLVPAAPHMPRPRTCGRRPGLPSRASLIEAFGSWDVVEPMLFQLLQEAHEDLAVLAHACACLDASLTAQRLHRLVGSVAFLGTTGLEPRAVQLIARVNQLGVARNAWALEQFQQDVETYLQCLADL